ncbi:hypothetical protein D9M71_211660 [compost metagenome]
MRVAPVGTSSVFTVLAIREFWKPGKSGLRSMERAIEGPECDAFGKENGHFDVGKRLHPLSRL